MLAKASFCNPEERYVPADPDGLSEYEKGAKLFSSLTLTRKYAPKISDRDSRAFLMISIALSKFTKYAA
jgi:hypothetical protein